MQIINLRLFFIIIMTCVLQSNEVDPLDMRNYDRRTKSMKKSNLDILPATIGANDRCITFVTRFINIMLRNTGLSNLNYKNINNVYLKTYTAVTISVKDFKTLEALSTGNGNINFNEIDQILSLMFQEIKNETTINFLSSIESNNSFYKQMIDLLYLLTIIGSFTLLLLLFYKYSKNIINLKLIMLVIFLLAFFSTWYTMYKKAEINRKIHMDQMPEYCYSKRKNWYGFSWFQNTDIEECKKFNEAIHLDPLYSIAITEVLAEMLSKIIMKPLECLGTSIYIFNNAALKDLPWWTQIVMIPIIIIVVIKTLLYSCALLVGRGLSMKSMFGFGDTAINSDNRHQHLKNNTFLNTCNLCTAAGSICNSVTSNTLPAFDNQKLNININLFKSENSNSGLSLAGGPSTDKNKTITHWNKIKALDDRSVINDETDSKSLVHRVRPRKMSL
ncbi:uncharacterized protein LOC126905484 [Daktulosphaira vitifoliae]|uniref:uncharacterized protein LOC126905484 n=1 Tax=Daktulosphaira vitifoliae TaxID=58002 RepID=UPI0021AA49A6|nr:uncharacterized protein LOC126905484 [Daktulosphaira vitifoliae]